MSSSQANGKTTSFRKSNQVLESFDAPYRAFWNVSPIVQTFDCVMLWPGKVQISRIIYCISHWAILRLLVLSMQSEPSSDPLANGFCCDESIFSKSTHFGGRSPTHEQELSCDEVSDISGVPVFRDAGYSREQSNFQRQPRQIVLLQLQIRSVGCRIPSSMCRTLAGSIKSTDSIWNIVILLLFGALQLTL